MMPPVPTAPPVGRRMGLRERQVLGIEQEGAEITEAWMRNSDCKENE